MARMTTQHGIGLALLTLAVACAGHPPPPRGATAATMASGRLPSGPAEPGRGLPMPSLDVAWTPPMLTAGDLEALSEGLSDDKQVALHLGRRFGGPEWTRRIASLLQALRPQAEVVATREDAGPFAGLSLPLERRGKTDSPRPRYDWTGGPLPAMDKTATADGGAVLVLDDATVEPGQWRALPAQAIGSCELPLAALAAGQEQSLAELEPFLDHADAVLWQVYGPALAAALPRMTAELKSYKVAPNRADFADGATFEQHECGHAYWRYVHEFAACGADAAGCFAAPRVFLVGGVRVGSAEPSVFVPPACAAKVGRDYVADLRSIATEAAEVAQEHLAPSWVALADRLGAVTEVYETLEDVCTPRRRRFSPEDLVAMRGRLAAIGDALASDDPVHPAARWHLEHSQFHVPGYGPVHEVAHYEAGPGSPSEVAVAEARGLREFVLKRALCRSGEPGLPLAVALVRDEGEVEFFGYFFEEELFCGELPPLWRSEAARSSASSDAPPPSAQAFPPASR